MVGINDVLDQIAARLHLSGRTVLSPFWSVTAPWALQLAQSDLYNVLASRGISVTLINGWTGADPWVLMQAVYYAMMAGAGEEDVDLEAVKSLNGLEILKTVALTDTSGAAIKGSAFGHGKISGGWDDVKGREPIPSRIGFVDPSTGRLRQT